MTRMTIAKSFKTLPITHAMQNPQSPQQGVINKPRISIALKLNRFVNTCHLGLKNLSNTGLMMEHNDCAIAETVIKGT